MGGAPDRPVAPGSAGVAARWLVAVAIASMAAAAAACGPRAPIAPVAPGMLALTPGGAVGLAATMEPTAGPSPTSAAPPTRVVAPPEPLSLPPHFGIGVFRDSLGPVRMIAVAPSGEVFATVPERNQILVLPDRDKDGVADSAFVYADSDPLNKPYDLAFREGWLYVAATDGVLRIPYQPGDLEARATAEMILPLPGEGVNQSRSLLFGPEGSMYVSVGSSCDACVEDDIRRACILRVEDDGAKVLRYASGVRNAIGLAVAPDHKSVLFTDNERDVFAEDKPPDELNLLVPGGDYGWPSCFGQREPATIDGQCQTTIPPIAEFPAHAGAAGMAFYTADGFPEPYRGGLFVALHGSWSRAVPVGYSVVFVPFEGASPAGPPQPFVQGWLREDTRRWASPVDVVVAADGALLVSDDGGGRIYRVFYDGPLGTPTPRFTR